MESYSFNSNSLESLVYRGAPGPRRQRMRTLFAGETNRARIIRILESSKGENEISDGLCRFPPKVDK